MKIKPHKFLHKNKTIELKLLIFSTSDQKIFKKTFNLWKQLNGIIKNNLKGTRILNLPDALSESIVCKELGFGKLISAKSTSSYSTSFDAFDYKNNKRIQVKCSTSTGPSSFGPKSVWDEIYFLDMWNNGNLNGEYKIYLIPNNFIYNIKVNKNQKMSDQQNQSRRPRFDLRSQIIIPNKIEPIIEGKI